MVLSMLFIYFEQFFASLVIINLVNLGLKLLIPDLAKEEYILEVLFLKGFKFFANRKFILLV